MYDNDYLEKILGEQYNMSNYFADTYVQPNVSIVETSANVEEKDKGINASTTNQSENEETKEVFAEQSDEINNPTNIGLANLADKKEIKQNDSTYNASENLKMEESENIDNKEEIHQFRAIQVNTDETPQDEFIKVSNMYPDIYNSIEPIVELVVNNNIDKRRLDEELVDTMTNKIYHAIKSESYPNNVLKVNSLPSDLKNTIPVSTRPHNNILRDLIKILVLNNILNNKQRPNRAPHHHKKPCIRCRNVSNNISYHDVPFPEDE